MCRVGCIVSLISSVSIHIYHNPNNPRCEFDSLPKSMASSVLYISMSFIYTRWVVSFSKLARVLYLPCGTGRKEQFTVHAVRRFQSPRPLRDGTYTAEQMPFIIIISIHPSLAGRDVLLDISRDPLDISIHPSLAGRDGMLHDVVAVLLNISIHPSLAGRDQGKRKGSKGHPISIHPSLAGRDACAAL